MIEQIKQVIKTSLENYYKENYGAEINVIVEEPKKQTLGDISIPMFNITKILKKPMPQIVEEAKKVVLTSTSLISEVNVTGAFINVLVDKIELGKLVIEKIIKEKNNYGNSQIGLNKNIVLDYSSPNIAKSFSIGHLRSTMIGNSLKLIMQKCGYHTVSINYLGDWGTQFGKMIVAYEMWGNDEEIQKDSIGALTKLYVRFNEEAKANPELDDKAREAFRRIELGEQKYLDMWKWIREESLKESQQIYDLLDVEFDSYNGEAFYNDKMDFVVKELENMHLLKEDQGAQIVELGDDLPPALIKRKDGGSLYITRDLAAVFYRMREYKFDKALYVVGNEQKLHFTQLKTVLNKMGYDYAKDLEHINFGLYLTNGKKMSTRQGNVVKLYDVLQKAIDLSYDLISEKNPDLENKRAIATSIGTGAVIFADLKNHRTLDIEFDINQSVKFEGQTGPYLQYTGVRIESILRDLDFDFEQNDNSVFDKPHYFELIKLLCSFGVTIQRAASEYAPSILAKHLLSLAQSFNKFYSLEKINVENQKLRNTNLALAYSIRVVLNEGLRILGIKSVEKM